MTPRKENRLKQIRELAENGVCRREAAQIAGYGYSYFIGLTKRLGIKFKNAPRSSVGRKQSKLSRNALLEKLSYDSSAGTFTWVSGPRVGHRAGHKNKLGYIVIGLRGESYQAHRLAWLYTHGEWPSEFVDHIDGNPSNNAISNLRLADAVQNQRNAVHAGFRKRKHGYANPYEAQIFVDGRSKHLGCFPTADLARAAYLEANARYFGEYSPVKSGRVK